MMRSRRSSTKVLYQVGTGPDGSAAQLELRTFRVKGEPDTEGRYPDLGFRGIHKDWLEATPEAALAAWERRMLERHARERQAVEALRKALRVKLRAVDVTIDN